jgi:hypothetical protein
MDQLPLVSAFVTHLRSELTLSSGLTADLKCVVPDKSMDILSAVHAMASLFGPLSEASAGSTELKSVRLAYVTDYPNAFYIFQGWSDASLGTASPNPYAQLSLVFNDQFPECIGPLTLAIARDLPLKNVDALHVEWLNPIEFEDWRTMLKAFDSLKTLSAYESPSARLTAVLLFDAEAAAEEPSRPAPGVLLPNLRAYTIDQISLHASYPCIPRTTPFAAILGQFLARRVEVGAPLTELALARPRPKEEIIRQDIERTGQLEGMGMTRVRWAADEESANLRFYERRMHARQEVRLRYGEGEEEWGF